MTMNELLKKTAIAGKYNQANKAARANAERLLEMTGAKDLATALGRK